MHGVVTVKIGQLALTGLCVLWAAGIILAWVGVFDGSTTDWRAGVAVVLPALPLTIAYASTRRAQAVTAAFEAGYLGRANVSPIAERR